MNLLHYLVVGVIDCVRSDMESDKVTAQSYTLSGLSRSVRIYYNVSETDVTDRMTEVVVGVLIRTTIAELIETPHADPRYRFNHYDIGNAATTIRDLRKMYDDLADVYKALDLRYKLGEDWLAESIRNSGRAYAESVRRGDATLPDIAPALAFPASDRLVSRSDNEQAFDGVRQALGSLAETISESNELDPHDRDYALVEIAIAEYALAQPQIPITLIERFNSTVLRWLARKFTSGVIQAAVSAAVKAIAGALGWSLT